MATTNPPATQTDLNFVFPPLPIPSDTDAIKTYPINKLDRKKNAYKKLNALVGQKYQAQLLELRKKKMNDLLTVHQIMWTNLVLAKEKKPFFDLEFDLKNNLSNCLYKNGSLNPTTPSFPKDFSNIVVERIGDVFDLSGIKNFPKLNPSQNLESLVKDPMDVMALQTLLKLKLTPMQIPWSSPTPNPPILKIIPDEWQINVKAIIPAEAQVNQGITINDGWFTAGLDSVAKLPSPNPEGFLNPIIGDFIFWNPVIGVAGFLFFKNGDWVPVIIDDHILVYKQVDNTTGNTNNPAGSTNKPKYQTVFAKCDNLNTDFWVPLLEKAYAKLHGDYESIEWGFAAQGVEDLTGGFTSYFDSDHLDKESFWKDQLKPIQIGFNYAIRHPLDTWQQDTVFGLFHWRKNNVEYNKANQLGKNGLFYNHVYILLGAYDIGGKRLVKIKSPWTGAEWKGNWSDWDDTRWKAHPQFASALDFKPFNKDSTFFTDYDTLLNQFQSIDKCEIISNNWYLTSIWLEFSLSSPKSPPPSFVFTVPPNKENKSTAVKIVLQQSDPRYSASAVIARLSFEIYPASAQVLVDEAPKYHSTELRSVSYDGKLKPGVYQVIPYVSIYQGNPEKISSIPIGLRIYSEPEITELIVGNTLPHLSKL
ncbi:10233_t:CDS:2 [Ambispora gerdemannii]|uniref:10233_t:CDS:1 n=1 Tax=Ambispora gerdemannii TaxID=144530 RepID=A0A9N8ZDA8_9GLOM|nr:10233_t:CDS:2 [Ambispora gerdemannii]